MTEDVLLIEPHIQLNSISIWNPLKVWYHNRMKRPRPLTIQGDIAIVPTYRLGDLLDSIIDAEDAPRVARFLFSCDNRGYPKTSNRKAKGSPYLHRMIMNASTGEQVDHINGNRLDNRKCNLRIVTNQQNQMARHAIVGRSGYKGVHKHGSSWRAYIKFNGKQIKLGVYPTPERAAKAYNQAAKALFGDYAVINETGKDRE